MTPQYPNVECNHHPGNAEPGYVVCLHVLEGVEVANFEPASSASVGTIVCATCNANRQDKEYNLDHLSLICCHCARDYGLLGKRVC